MSLKLFFEVIKSEALDPVKRFYYQAMRESTVAAGRLAGGR
jgi:hypothetical protein